MGTVKFDKSVWEQLPETTHYDSNKMARILNLSPRHLRRLSRRVVGCPPQEWLEKGRLEAAKRLLLAGQSVKKTSADLWFKYDSHFCSWFKRHTTMTPSEFVAMNACSQCPPDIMI